MPDFRLYFTIKAVSEKTPLIVPPHLERVGHPSGVMNYSLVSRQTLEQDQDFVLQMTPIAKKLRSFHDDFVIVAQSRERSYRFPISIAGRLLDSNGW